MAKSASSKAKARQGKRNGDTPNQQGVKSTAEHNSKPPRVRNRHGPGNKLKIKLLEDVVEAHRVEAEQIESENVEARRLEAEQVESERAEAERAEAEQIEQERTRQEWLVAHPVEANLQCLLAQAPAQPSPNELAFLKKIARLCLGRPAQLRNAVQCLVQDGETAADIWEAWSPTRPECLDSALLAEMPCDEPSYSQRCVVISRFSGLQAVGPAKVTSMSVGQKFFARRFDIEVSHPSLSALSFANKKSTDDFTEFREFRRMREQLDGSIRFIIRGVDGLGVDIRHWKKLYAQLTKAGVRAYICFYLDQAGGFSRSIPLQELIVNNGQAENHAPDVACIRTRWNEMRILRLQGANAKGAEDPEWFAQYAALGTRGRNDVSNLSFVQG